MKAVLSCFHSILKTKKNVMGNSLNNCCYTESGRKSFTMWNMLQLFNSGDSGEENVDYCCIILNTPISNEKLLKPIWNEASFKLVVDGGSNNLYSVIKQYQDSKNENFSLPNVVSGDFDSAEPLVLKYFKEKNALIVRTPDQNKTDFFKALEIVVSTTKFNLVVVYCEHFGRFDQIMGNVHILYKVFTDSRMKHLKVFLLANDCLSWILKSGQHMIQIPEKLWSEKSYCSLIPLGSPCHHVSTSGLKWNLHDATLEFGGMVSTSNTYDLTLSEHVVCVSTSESILWNMTV